jgi:hypothetical protein
MEAIAHHNLGHVSERPGYNVYAIELSQEWLDVLAFCEETNTPPEDLLQDLNFGLLDG